MKIDTEIRHVTKPGGNLFLELGFSQEQAQRLHLASQQQINDTKQIKGANAASISSGPVPSFLKYGFTPSSTLKKISRQIPRLQNEFSID